MARCWNDGLSRSHPSTVPGLHNAFHFTGRRQMTCRQQYRRQHSRRQHSRLAGLIAVTLLACTGTGHAHVVIRQGGNSHNKWGCLLWLTRPAGW